MIDKLHVEQALAEALRTGGDFAELFAQDRRSSTTALRNRMVENAVAARSHGAGIRVYKGLNSVYVHTNDTSLAGLLDAARKAADAVGAAAGGVDVHLAPSRAPSVHAFGTAVPEVPGARRADLLRRASAAARAVSAEVELASARLTGCDEDILIANSEGLCVADRRMYTRFSISCVACSAGENQTGSESPGALMGFELFDERVDVEAAARTAAQRAVTMLHAEPCPAGVMPVVIDGGFGGVIFHEACGHSLEAAAVAFGNSEFCGKLGQAIASPVVTAIDDGTLPNEWGSTSVDDEGTPTTKLVLIENGVLKNYMVDRLNGRRMGLPTTGSARRQNYAFAPTSRMRNTYIAPGNDDEAEILATCGDGLYAKAMGGGSVNPVTGEFNFAVSEGYLIRDGKVVRPVRGAMLIGKGAEVLKRIDRVGKKMWMAQGMCGASSGSVPVNVGQPMIRVTGLTVGGR